MEEQLNTSLSKLTEKLTGWFDALILSLPNFLIALLVFVISYWLSGTLKAWVNRLLRDIVKQPSIRGLISNVVSISTIIIGLILALAILNLDGTLKSLLAGAGVAGLAISLALQGTLSNTFSGLFIAVKDEMNVGDWVETNGYSGSVQSIDLRNTKVLEPDNNLVVIPNRLIIENPFKNYGLTQRIRCNLTCGVGYESDLKQVKELAVEAIQDTFEPGEDESIEFYYTDFGASSIDFLLRFWVAGTKKMTALEVKSQAIMIIKETFDSNEINIPFPIRTVIQQGD